VTTTPDPAALAARLRRPEPTGDTGIVAERRTRRERRRHRRAQTDPPPPSAPPAAPPPPAVPPTDLDTLRDTINRRRTG
jgi:hypothetical protein